MPSTRVKTSKRGLEKKNRSMRKKKGGRRSSKLRKLGLFKEGSCRFYCARKEDLRKGRLVVEISDEKA